MFKKMGFSYGFPEMSLFKANKTHKNHILKKKSSFLLEMYCS